ncbi:unnamed protein product, partial [Prorocentrum cordatum]
KEEPSSALTSPETARRERMRYEWRAGRVVDVCANAQNLEGRSGLVWNYSAVGGRGGEKEEEEEEEESVDNSRGCRQPAVARTGRLGDCTARCFKRDARGPLDSSQAPGISAARDGGGGEREGGEVKKEEDEGWGWGRDDRELADNCTNLYNVNPRLH